MVANDPDLDFTQNYRFVGDISLAKTACLILLYFRFPLT